MKGFAQTVVNLCFLRCAQATDMIPDAALTVSVYSESVSELNKWLLDLLVAAMFPLSVVVLSCLALAAATDVDPCPGGRTVETLRSDVVLTPCKKVPCKLKKNTNEQVSFKFKTDKEIKELKNHVSAEVLGVPLPFVGVDGNSVCGKLETEAGEKISCPIPAGTYVYKDSFPILSFYPSISVRVHWALQSDGKDVACFEVPASIK